MNHGFSLINFIIGHFALSEDINNNCPFFNTAVYLNLIIFYVMYILPLFAIITFGITLLLSLLINFIFSCFNVF